MTLMMCTKFVFIIEINSRFVVSYKNDLKVNLHEKCLRNIIVRSTAIIRNAMYSEILCTQCMSKLF